MLRHNRHLRDTQGFTLIELLIVVVIIGILAAIAIPQFASTKEKAFDAAAKSDLRNMMSAQEAYFADFQTYATATSTLETEDLFNPSTGVTATVQTASASSYTATATHSGSPDAAYCVNTDGSASNPGEIVKIAKAATTCP